MLPTAIEAVMSTPELLETILLHLDMVTLLVSAQRVSRRWLDTMTASPSIQQALFFKPIPDPLPHRPPYKRLPHQSSFDYETLHQVLDTQNPLLVKHFGRTLFSRRRYVRRFWSRDTFMTLPWHYDIIGDLENSTPLPWYYDADFRIAPEHNAEITRRRRRFTRAGASWRRMLVSQPPPPALGYLELDTSDDTETLSRGLVDLPSGLSLGLLYDFVEDRVSRQPSKRLWFRVTWAVPAPGLSPDIAAIERACTELMKQTIVVVDIRYSVDSYPHRNESDDDFDLDAWAADFRCDDFQPVEIETVEIFRGTR